MEVNLRGPLVCEWAVLPEMVALPSPTWALGRPIDDGPGLPMAAHGGNISLERRIIRGMSVVSRSNLNLRN